MRRKKNRNTKHNQKSHPKRRRMNLGSRSQRINLINNLRIN